MKILEIEIKSKCEDIEKIKSEIEALGAKFFVNNVEEDIYFNHACKEFSETDEALRIRSIGDNYILTYKGPKHGGLSKTREENETKFEDFVEMEKIIKNLGFRKSGIVKKYRTIYKLEDISFCLDSVEGVGDFIEIEKMGKDKEKIEKELFTIADKLNLKEFITTSYLEMILKKSE